MVAMVSDAEAALDQVGHPLRRPQLGRVPPGPGSPNQLLLQTEELLDPHLGRPTGPPSFLQTGQTFPVEMLLPTADRLAVRFQATGHLARFPGPPSQTRRLSPPALPGRGN